MNRIFLIFVLISIPIIQNAQIIADHSVVDKYDDIPQQWIDKVKTMLVEMAGESHASTFNYGANLLEQYDVKFQANYFGGSPPSPVTNYLRIGKIDNVGEETYFTSQNAITGYKSRIATQNNTANKFDVMGFVWCWDMYYDPPPRGTIDPEYNIHWGGMLVGSPDGDRVVWGLDSGDSILTGNRLNMDTYLYAVQEFQQYCIDNNWDTKIIFTTGPVDDSYPNSSGTEDGVQRELKHDHIRNFVLADNSRILFDYADILCWNNDGEQHTDTWFDGVNQRIHAQIHPDNEMDYDGSWNIIPGIEDGDHIGEVGSLRIMKAMWWMLARIAGWDGGIITFPVTSIEVSAVGDIPAITTNKGSLQLNATILPYDATVQAVTWSIINLSGEATISTSGLVKAVRNGEIKARATAIDGSAIFGELSITITNQINSNLPGIVSRPHPFVKVNKNNIEVFLKEEEPVKKLSLHSIYGQLILQNLVNDNYCSFNTQSIAPGIYIISSDSIEFKNITVFIY